MPRNLFAAGVVLLASFSVMASAQDLNEALFAAARKGDAAAVKALLAKGVDVNAKAAYGATALSFACDKGHTEVVKVLLAHKADVNVKDTFYKATPLTWAVQKGHAPIVKLLVEAGAEGSESALSYAASKNDAELVKLALERAKPKQKVLDAALAATKDKAVSELLTKAGAKATEVPPSKLDAEALKTYAGNYRNEEGMTEYQVSVEKDQLVVKTSGFEMYRLRAVDKDKFQATTSDEVTAEFSGEGVKRAVVVKRGKTELMRLTKAEPRAPAATAKIDDKAGPITTPGTDPPFAAPAPPASPTANSRPSSGTPTRDRTSAGRPPSPASGSVVPSSGAIAFISRRPSARTTRPDSKPASTATSIPCRIPRRTRSTCSVSTRTPATFSGTKSPTKACRR